MARRFTIRVGDRTAVAELLDEAAPNVAQRFWESLPLESFAIHAKFAGGEMIVNVPFYSEPENLIFEVRPGDIAYARRMQTLCVFYDDVTPFGYVSVFARIVEGLEEIQAAARSLLDTPSLPAAMAPLGSPPGPGVTSIATAVGTDLAGTVRAFLQDVWEQEPEDVRRMWATPLPPGGRWSGAILVNMILLWAGQTLLVLHRQVREGAVDPGAGARVAAGHLRELAGWLAHWRMDDTVVALRRAVEGLGQERSWSTEELLPVLEQAMLVLNRMQNWIDAYVPWAQLDRLLLPVDTV